MIFTHHSRSTRWISYCVVVISIAAAIAVFIGNNVGSGVASAQDGPINQSVAAVFSNTTPITIGEVANSTGVPYPSAITVSGLTGNIANTAGSVKVTINNFSHTFNSDVVIALVGPGGQAIMLQGRAGEGLAQNNTTYTLSDTGATFIPDPSWGPGTYKPTNWDGPTRSFPAPGPGTNYANPGNPVAPGPATLTSVYGNTAPNGTWNLFVFDPFNEDGGSIAGGWTLELTTAGGPPVPDSLADFDGDGKTDYAVIRLAGGQDSQATWYILNHNFNQRAQNWGLGGDEFVPADFDGDGKDDIAIWRRTAQSAFYVIQSQTNTIRVEDWGLPSDNPSVVGDYNNDGRDDFAVYRPGATLGAQSFWYWRSSASSTGINVVDWGLNGDNPAPGDYDGDGRMDYAIQRGNGGNGVFYIRYTSLIAPTVTTFGSANDWVVPGDYDNDSKTDLCVVGTVGGFLQWTLRPSGGGADIVEPWGFPSDYPAPGDYNGDGKADFAVWRFGALSTFWVFRPITREIDSRQWGLIDDNPVTFTYVH